MKNELVEVGKSLLIFLIMVTAVTLLATLLISLIFGVAFEQVLIWTSILAVLLVALWQRAMWVPKNKGE